MDRPPLSHDPTARLGDAAASGFSAVDVWRKLEAKLRPFVARRVRSKVDVDDIMQEVFLRMQRGLPGLRDHERFGPWLYQIARSAVADHLRVAAKFRVQDSTDEDHQLSDSDDDDRDDDDRAAERELASHMALLVAMLPSPYREALTLVELEGHSQKRAAEIVGVSLSGMKSRVQRGRARLRTMLERCCHIALDARSRVMSCEPRVDGRLPIDCCG
jgi:RNA polymerase sigma-70 factor (ECF subfamily)